MRLIDADELKTAFPACDNSKPVLVACVRATINHMPTIEPFAQPMRKRGKWIFYETENDRYDDMKCPFCKKSYTIDAYRIDDIGFTAEDFNYCPNCGADLREGGQDE